MPKKDTKLENLSKTIHMLVEETRLSELEGLDHIFMGHYTSVFPYLIMDTVHKNERIDRGKGAGLPFLDLGQDLICDLADHFSR